MRYYCCTEERRIQVRLHDELNGIDYLEVVDDPLDPVLELNFLKPVPPLAFGDVSFVISGGDRIPEVSVTDFIASAPDQWRLSVSGPGDFSNYTLQVIPALGAPLKLDPLLDRVDFSFKIDCDTDFDCLPELFCPPEEAEQPIINYLAKDYASFRRLILDRLALLMPEWQERSAADLNMALVEMLAYVGDYLSYRQDAVATEAYLGTARRRTSVRRHARLVDYFMHEGRNAEVWVQVRVSADDVELPRHSPIFTRVETGAVRYPPSSKELEDAWRQRPVIFETTADAFLYAGHNEMDFYTWGEDDCCLPAGSTSATLAGDKPFLKAGDVLIFVEVRGPETLSEADADPDRRHAVRLTHVSRSNDPLGGRFLPSPTNAPVTITEIFWDRADALPFPVCINSGGQVISRALGNIVQADHGSSRVEVLEEVVPRPHLWFVAAGHSDHCHRIPPQEVPARYHPRLGEKGITNVCRIEQEPLLSLPFTPALKDDLDAAVAGGKLSLPLQQALNQANRDMQDSTMSVRGREPLWSLSDGRAALLIRRKGGQLNLYSPPPAASGAADHVAGSTNGALPAVTLAGVLLPDDETGAANRTAELEALVDLLDDTEQARQDLCRLLALQYEASFWAPQADLLNSGAGAQEFVVETETDATAFLRFGDNEFGRRPPGQTLFVAFYRVGNGTAGNIGRNTLAHLVTNINAIVAVDNPLPAAGGRDPETINEVRRRAPVAFRRQERAVTPDDYAAFAARHPEVQRAAATLRWTGSWNTMFLTVDRLGGAAVDPDFEVKIRRYLERYRLAGHDLEVDSPQAVSLEVDMTVCVLPDHFRSAVRRALLQRFSNRVHPDGSRGIFHPDNFTFGQPVYLSRLIAEAAHVEGVESVEITKFQRQGQDDARALDLGWLEIGRLEIARLDNDPNFPERGVFRLTMLGGK